MGGQLQVLLFVLSHPLDEGLARPSPTNGTAIPPRTMIEAWTGYASRAKCTGIRRVHAPTRARTILSPQGSRRKAIGLLPWSCRHTPRQTSRARRRGHRDLRHARCGGRVGQRKLGRSLGEPLRRRRDADERSRFWSLIRLSNPGAEPRPNETLVDSSSCVYARNSLQMGWKRSHVRIVSPRPKFRFKF
jgi:hypothetical protein